MPAVARPAPPGALRQALRALRAWWRPPRSLKVTRTGRVYLVVTIGVGLGALNTGNNLLYLVLGFLLTLIIVSGVLSERCLRGLSVRRLGAESAYAGEPFAFRYELRKEGGASYALEVTEDTPELSGVAKLPYLADGGASVARADFTATRRGPYRLERLKVTTTFPLGLFAKTRLYDLDDLLLVFPRRGFACVDPLESSDGPAGDAGNPRRRDGTGDLLGLTEVHEGEDVRRVHWLKSAAAGKLLRTEREREERRQFVLSVDDALAGEALERRCEETATQSQRLLSQGYEVGLETGAQRLRPAAGPGQARRILSALAWVGYAEGEP